MDCKPLLLTDVNKKYQKVSCNMFSLFAIRVV